jgi:gamma-glutamylcyclotransferase (GGCT)/AIG2-like uncharacterized protein YtfP
VDEFRHHGYISAQPRHFMETAPRHLFVYGTLLPGLAPPIIADVVNRLRIVGEATVPGQLYDFGEYPGCTLDADCDSLIHGKLLELPDQALLDQLDWYEGYAAHDASGSLFLRTICAATMTNGERIRAWAYVYNRVVSSARRIESGRYWP